VKVARETVKGGYALVLTDELKRWIDEKKPMLVVDTMPKKDSHDKQHIPGLSSSSSRSTRCRRWRRTGRRPGRGSSGRRRGA